jgi:hypothetical protein
MAVYWGETRESRGSVVAVVVGLALALGVGYCSPASAQQLRMGIDGPMGDTSSSVALCGFALDLDARPRPGIGAVVATFYTPAGQVDIPAHLGYPRADIAATYGLVQDANVGWCVPPTAIPAGFTLVTVRATSNRFAAPDGRPLGVQRDWSVCYACNLFAWVNTPKQGQVVPQWFTMAGVARNLTGYELTMVVISALNRATPHYLPTRLGEATINQPRPEPAWNGYGWTFATSLAPGTYDLIVEAWGLVLAGYDPITGLPIWTRNYEARVVRVTVQ